MAVGKFDCRRPLGGLLIAWSICGRGASNNVSELVQRIVFVIAVYLLLNCDVCLFGVSLVHLVWVWYVRVSVYMCVRIVECALACVCMCDTCAHVRVWSGSGLWLT